MSRTVFKVEDLRSTGAPDYVERDGKLICVLCGLERKVGQDPYCPHGMFGRGLSDPFEEYIDPHILPHTDPRAQEVGFNRHLGRNLKGTRITSREQRRALMKEQGLDWAGRDSVSGGREF